MSQSHHALSSPTRPAMLELKKVIPEAMAAEAKIELGGRLLSLLEAFRELRKGGAAECTMAAWGRQEIGRIPQYRQPVWDSKTFAANCIGCHATAVDSKALTYSSPSLDCYTAMVPLIPSTRKIPPCASFAELQRPARVTISVCAQCHAGRHSLSSNLPYANNFLAGTICFVIFRSICLQSRSRSLIQPIGTSYATFGMWLCWARRRLPSHVPPDSQAIHIAAPATGEE